MPPLASARMIVPPGFPNDRVEEDSFSYLITAIFRSSRGIAARWSPLRPHKNAEYFPYRVPEILRIFVCLKIIFQVYGR